MEALDKSVERSTGILLYDGELRQKHTCRTNDRRSIMGGFMTSEEEEKIPTENTKYKDSPFFSLFDDDDEHITIGQQV
jgi:hypothetical protein